MANRFEKYANPAQTGNRFAKYAGQRASQYSDDQEKIIRGWMLENRYRDGVMGRLEKGYQPGPNEVIFGQNPENDRKVAIAMAEQNNWQPAPKRENASTSFADGAVSSATLYFNDELAGLASGAVDAVQGKSFSEGYKSGRATAKRQERESKYSNPEMFLAGEIGGGVASAVVPIGMGARAAQGTGAAAKTAANSTKAFQPIRAGFGLMGRGVADVGKTIGGGMVGGGLWGAAAGAGMADGGGMEERARGAGQGLLFGSLAGGAMAPVMRYGAAPVISWAGRKFGTSAENKLFDAVIKRMQRSGKSLDDVQAQFDAWRATGEVPETFAEMLGPHEQQLLSAMITSNKSTRDAATKVYTDRGKGELEWLEDRIAAAYGKSRADFGKMREAAAKARGSEPAPYYNAAHYEPNSDTLKMLPAQAKGAFDAVVTQSRTAQKALTMASDDLDAAGLYAARDALDAYIAAAKKGQPLPDLPVQAADYVERIISDNLNALYNGKVSKLGTIRGLTELQGRTRAAIDGTGLGEAREQAAEMISRHDALGRGRKIFDANVDPEDVTGFMDSASDEVQAHYGAGVSRALSKDLRRQSDMKGFADKSRSIARSADRREKIELSRPQVLKKDGTPDGRYKQTRLNQQMDDALDRVSNRAEHAVDMVGNSKTAFRIGDVEDAMLDDTIQAHIGDTVADVLTGGPLQAVQAAWGKGGRALADYISRPSVFNPAFNDAGQKVLLAQGDEIPVQIAKLLARQQETQGRRLLPTLPQNVGSRVAGLFSGKNASENDPYVQNYEEAVLPDIAGGIETPAAASLFDPGLSPERRDAIEAHYRQMLQSSAIDQETRAAIEALLSESSSLRVAQSMQGSAAQ